jgi:hypothetical protein
MDKVIEWLVDLNKNSHWYFAAMTVLIMATVGLALGGLIELVFKALGIKHDKIEIEH